MGSTHASKTSNAAHQAAARAAAAEDVLRLARELRRARDDAARNRREAARFRRRWSRLRDGLTALLAQDDGDTDTETGPETDIAS